jgi:hypothetical protein
MTSKAFFSSLLIISVSNFITKPPFYLCPGVNQINFKDAEKSRCFINAVHLLCTGVVDDIFRFTEALTSPAADNTSILFYQ